MVVAAEYRVAGGTPMSEPTKTMSCPKCDGAMRTYARNGITIDQCNRCRGIFLDRGELEQLIGAESSFLGRQGLPGGGHSGPPER